MYMCYNLRVHSLRDAPLARKFPTSSFQLQVSNFKFPTSIPNFKFPTSSFQLQASNFNFQLQVSNLKFSSFQVSELSSFQHQWSFSKHIINKHPQNNLATLIFPDPNTQINIQHTISLKLFVNAKRPQNNLINFP
jgi:hypothetical protein